MPKRGGRKRLRRTSIAAKGRVSAYCISSELKIQPLLEFLQSKSNRKQPPKVRGNQVYILLALQLVSAVVCCSYLCGVNCNSMSQNEHCCT
jgi:hypothetical protein